MRKRFMLIAILGASVAFAGDEARERKTRVTSQRMDFDYKRMVAVFTGDVVVVDPEVRISTDKMTMAFDEKKEVKLVTCAGNVKIFYQDKTAKASRAVYQARKGEIELLGDAELSRGVDTVKGDRIVFNLYDETLVCEPGYLVLTPGASKDDSLKSLLPGEKK